jgi:Na+/H+ antiporter NhaA
MALFFLVVGLELRREIEAGELSSPKRAALPFVAALGGIGFTVALFVAALAFREPERLDEAKVATVVASIVSGGAALVTGRPLLPRS